MKVVYPFGAVKSKAEFPAAASAHVEGALLGHLAKLEGFCKGPYMCGSTPQSGDFHVWEMLDQHQTIASKSGFAFSMDKYPKLKAMYDAFAAEPKMAKYFSSSMYKRSHNNSMFTHFTGLDDHTDDGPSSTEKITF